MSGDIDFLIPGGGSGGSGGAPSGPAGGDLGSTYPNPTVTGAHFGGADGNFFVRRSGLWAPGTIAAGDLPGTVAQTGQANNFGAFVQSAAAFAANLSGGSSRFVGLTSGAPGAGTFLVGDFAVDAVNGTIYICGTGGSPGTWFQILTAPGNQLVNGANGLTVLSNGSMRSTAGAATLGALQTNVASQFISGNDSRGYVRFTASATGPTAGSAVAIVNFSTTLSFPAIIVLSLLATVNAEYGDSVGTSQYSAGWILYPQITALASSNPSGFTIRTAIGLSASLVYACAYQVLL